VLQDECAVRLAALFAAFVSAGSSISVESLEAVGHMVSILKFEFTPARISALWPGPCQANRANHLLH
jgi:hypothetical protein